LSQMLRINERLDKLSAAYTDFLERGMLESDPFINLLPTLPHNPTSRFEAEQEDSAGVDLSHLLAKVKLCRTRGQSPVHLYHLLQTHRLVQPLSILVTSAG
jgi:hypothetical protein